MKVTELFVAGQGGWSDLGVDRLSPELNVFYSPPRGGKSTIAQLAAQLLYGRTTSSWRRQFGQTTPLVDGSLSIDSPQGAYQLRRRRDGSPQGQLMVAGSGGDPVDSRTIHALLYEVSPRLLAELYAIDFAELPHPDALLKGQFARQFTQAVAHESVTPTVQGDSSAPGGISSIPSDRSRIDALVHLRDEVVRQLEEQMSGQLRTSAAAEQELTEVDAALAERRSASEKLRVRLRSAEAELAELNARLRLFAMESVVPRGADVDGEKHRRELEQLDGDIGRLRQALSDLQSRQATVRRELAEVQPDGTADSPNVLAAQRATLSALERLLDDLDAEVSQLARALEPGRAVGPEAHARLAPVAELLRQQAYAMCGQLTTAERTHRRRTRATESRQLDRAQADLGEQLDHLLERRQALVYEADLSARPMLSLAQPPVNQHCQCQRHEEFVRRSDAMVLTRPDRARKQEDSRRRRTELERERDRVRTALADVEREIAELAARWQRLQEQRTGAVHRTSTSELKAELERLDRELDRALIAPARAVPHVQPAWRASDVLARLTGGQLTQIRLRREGAAAAVLDRTGRLIVIDALSAPQRDQLYLALTLALVSSLSNHGVDLPLVLDEPFLRQDTSGGAAMAGVLAEFAREGRQVLVFTEDREAVRRFAGLGIEVRDLDQLRRQRAATTGASAAVATVTAHAETVPIVRVVREPVGSPAAPIRWESSPAAAQGHKEIYFLGRNDSLAEFPVLGPDTTVAFSELGLHSVEDLLSADAASVAHGLKRTGLSAATVRLWQTHMSLMCFVPTISLVDAQVLAACDISSPEALYTIDVTLLADAAERFLSSERGRRFVPSRERFMRDRLAEMQKLARGEQDRWREATRRYGWVDRQPTTGAAIPTPSIVRRRVRRARPVAPPRFLLEPVSPVGGAPSVGRHAVERLSKVGVRTVADLLNANPDSIAEEIGEPRMPAALISRWQHEARLACRIPDLRALGARLLAACGFTQPEQVAGANVDELAERVARLCQTAEGSRLLHGEKPPSRARIAAWIERANQRRPLEAA